MSYIGPGNAVGNVPVWNGSYWVPKDPTTGVDVSLQAFLPHRRWRLLLGINGSGGTDVGQLWTKPSTLTSQVPDWSTNWLSVPKSVGVSGAAAGSGTQWITNSSTEYVFFSTINSFSGGFLMKVKGGFHTAQATSRCFIGFKSVLTSTANVEPSTLTNVVGFGNDSTDANLKIMHNDGAGTCTKVDLGANFPAQTNSADLYEFILYSAPNQTSLIQYYIRHVFSGNTASGDITTNSPAAGTSACFHLWFNNGTTAAAVRYGIASIYVEGP